MGCIIITGGTGLIGSRLAKNLAEGGYEVVVLSRNPAGHDLLNGVRAVQWDARTAVGWGHLADGAAAIVNLAGASIAGEGFVPARWTAQRKQLLRQSRINAGQAVVAAISQAENKPRVLLQASAVGYYGGRGDEILRADAAPGYDFLAALCQEWEAETAVVEQWGVRRVLLRTGVVLSAAGGALPRLMLPFKLFVGGPLGSGRQYMPWIHLDDAVQAMRFLLEHDDAQGAYNLAATRPLTNKEFGRILGKVLKRPAYLPVPAFALRLLLGEVADVVLKGQRAIPAGLQNLGFEFAYPDAEAALQELIS